MSSVSACGSGTKPFTRDEEEALKKDDSTSSILNRVRQDAGGKGTVEVRGDDKTRREVDQADKKHFGAQGALEGAKGLLVEAPHLAEVGIEGVPGGLGVVAGAVGTLALYAAHVVHMEEQKKKLQEAVTKDELHVTLLAHLELPQAYKSIEMKRRPDAGQSFQSETQKMTTQLATKDKALVATLQLHCDRGMHAALDCRASGKSKKEFLEANPKIARACAEDAAFREGFEAIMWCGDQNVAEAKKALEARDARYACANVAVRG